MENCFIKLNSIDDTTTIVNLNEIRTIEQRQINKKSKPGHSETINKLVHIKYDFITYICLDETYIYVKDTPDEIWNKIQEIIKTK